MSVNPTGSDPRSMQETSEPNNSTVSTKVAAATTIISGVVGYGYGRIDPDDNSLLGKAKKYIEENSRYSPPSRPYDSEKEMSEREPPPPGEVENYKGVLAARAAGKIGRAYGEHQRKKAQD